MKARHAYILGIVGIAVFIGVMAMNADASGTEVIYSDDFEADDGGWTPWANWDPVGDWEWTDTYDVSSYAGSHNPPTVAHSGDGLWGTVLYDDYTNSGGETYISKTFDFSGYSNVNMTFWYWSDLFGTWDYAKLYVNGVEVWYVDTQPGTAWEQAAIDLSPWDYMSDVNVTFEVHASTVVNYAGLYIDDFNLTGVLSRYVDDDFDAATPGWGTTHFDSIQDAIDAAGEGCTIYVWDGLYNETNIHVDKTLTIIGNTTVDAMTGAVSCNTNVNYTDKGFIVKADHVNISGFNLTNNGVIAGCRGVLVNHSSHCNISGNIIQEDYDGIKLNHSDDNIVYNNIIRNQSMYGIWLNNASNNVVNSNGIYNNYIGVFYQPEMMYQVMPACWNTIVGNNISHNGWGIEMFGTYEDDILSNTFWYNGEISGGKTRENGGPADGGAIHLLMANDTYISGNHMKYNFQGIWMENCDDNVVEHNEINQSMIIPNGNGRSYHIYVEGKEGWTLVETLHLSRNYERTTVTLPSGAGEYRVRIVQSGGVAAHVDQMVLLDGETVVPVSAVCDGSDIVEKLYAVDNDVADIWERTIELTWQGTFVSPTLLLVANEEQPAYISPIRTPSIMHPTLMELYTLEDSGAIMVDGEPDDLAVPDFSDYWAPTSGHPAGDTLVWLRSDGEYLYGAMEVTADNTYDMTGWGSLYIATDNVVREFRVDASDESYGVGGFVYTDTVGWQHMLYEFQIPLADIDASIGDTIRVGYGSYGTLGGMPAGVQIDGMDGDGSYNVIQYNNISGYNSGIYLVHTDHEEVWYNNISSNGYGVYIDNTWYSNVTCNHIYSNGDGIYAYYAEYNNITGNDIDNNHHGVGLTYYSRNNNIAGNNIQDNTNWGIALHPYADNNHVIDNDIAANRYGIYISGNSPSFAPDGNTILDCRASTNTMYDFYATNYTYNTVVTNLTVSSYPTSVDFIYGDGIALKGVAHAELALNPGYAAIDKFLNITNVTATSWINITIYYEQDDVSETDEDTLALQRLNGTAWEMASPDYEMVNICENYLRANLSEFSIFGVFGNFSRYWMNLSEGWNMVSLPVWNSSFVNAQDLGEWIPDCTMVSRWNPQEQMYVTHVVGYGSGFQLVNGSGYFVYVTADVSKEYTGMGQAMVNLTVMDGYNLLGWTQTIDTNASVLLASIENCLKLGMYDPSLGWLPQYFAGSPAPLNFEVVAGDGVFVYVTTGSSAWNGT